MRPATSYGNKYNAKYEKEMRAWELLRPNALGFENQGEITSSLELASYTWKPVTRFSRAKRAE